jgi:hypothetical protein
MYRNTMGALVRFWAGKIACGLALTVLVANFSSAGEYRTPRAGESFTTELFGQSVTAPSRDRCSVTALNLGVQWLESAPRDYEVLPYGAFFLWRNKDNGRKRLRAVLAGVYNEVRYHVNPAWLGKTELVLTFENMTVPLARQEFVEGARIDEEELEWYRAHLGFGFGWHTPLAPGYQDNAMEMALTYEPGILLFSDGSDTAGGFREPRDTYEGRVHVRMRADALERNIMELPHAGWAAGFDGWYAHRSRWDDWGGDTISGTQDGNEHRTWYAGRFFALAALPMPLADGERNRLIASLYGGIGSDLDRFSAFRLGGEPTGGEWEALSRPNVMGAIFDEFYSRSYAVLNLEYRRELLFFCYLHLRGQFAWVDRPRIEDGLLGWEMEALPAVGVAVTCGAPWNSQVEIGFCYNFGLLREEGGDSDFGGSALNLSWSKEF